MRVIRKWNTKAYTVFLKDTEQLKIKKAYDRLKHKISLKSGRMSHEALIQALDSAADDYLLASDLFLLARDEYDKFEIHYEMVWSTWMYDAQKDLEKDKKSKKITSQITESLKRAWIYRKQEEEVKILEQNKRELKVIRLRMENLKDAWKHRMSSLQSQARAIESQRQIRLGGGKD